ncbi:MAG: hypothetical protein GWP62_11120 [Gammaproteobacteria bacterium]|nr:hypothetical protein [Gammaproteobacteria bacterium]
MKIRSLQTMLAATAMLASGTAIADFGVGVKAGTLGLGLEARWDPPIPWFDLRVGVNSYDYNDKAGYGGIDYEATLALDNYYLTTNFKFPASPFRLTLGAFANGNEIQLASQDLGGANFNIGGSSFFSSDVGNLEGVVSFDSTSPYLGFGFDFELFGKAGLNLDFGLLWQGEPTVTLNATGLDSAPAQVQAPLSQALEAERLELEEEMSNYKAWPVVSLAFVYNF